MSQTPHHRSRVRSLVAARGISRHRPPLAVGLAPLLLGSAFLTGCAFPGSGFGASRGAVAGSAPTDPFGQPPAAGDDRADRGTATRTPRSPGGTRPGDWAPEAAYPDLDREADVAAADPPRFGDQRTWPVDPEDPAAGGRPAASTDSFAQATSLWGDWGDYYDGPPLGRDRFDGGATLTMVTDSEVGFTITPNVSRDGSRIVFVSDEFGEASDIFVRRVNGSTKTRITHDAAIDVTPVFSPDGTEIAYASNREGQFDIYVIPVTGGAPTRLTNAADGSIHPSFSPDGRRVAYCRKNSRTNRWEIWMTDRDTGQETLLHYGMFPEWNPDPARPSLVFQQGRERSHRFFGIWTIDIVDGEASAPTEIASAANYACMHPTWSPDGTRIAFTAVPEQSLGTDLRPGLGDIWIVGADGRERRQLTMSRSFNQHPSWSRDGTIFFGSDRSGVDNVWALRDPDTLIRRGERGDRMTSVDPATATAPTGGGR